MENLRQFLFKTRSGRVIAHNEKHARLFGFTRTNDLEFLGVTEDEELVASLDIDSFIEGSMNPKSEEQLEKERKEILDKVVALDLPKDLPRTSKEIQKIRL